MALQKCAVNTNSEFKEMHPHGTSAFPCAGYEDAITGRIEVLHVFLGDFKNIR